MNVYWGQIHNLPEFTSQEFKPPRILQKGKIVKVSLRKWVARDSAIKDSPHGTPRKKLDKPGISRKKKEKQKQNESEMRKQVFIALFSF